MNRSRRGRHRRAEQDPPRTQTVGVAIPREDAARFNEILDALDMYGSDVLRPAIYSFIEQHADLDPANQEALPLTG